MNWEEKMAREAQNDTIIDQLITTMLHNVSCDNVLRTTDIIRDYRNNIFSIKQQSPDLEKLYEAMNIPVLSEESGHYQGAYYYIGYTPDGEKTSNIGTYYFSQKGENNYERIYQQAGLENVVYRYYEEMLGQYRRALLKQKARPTKAIPEREFELS